MQSLSFFEGLSPEEHLRVLGRLKRRTFPTGSTLIVEGEERREIYIIEAGAALILVKDREGIEHTVNHVGPGATLGEVSFFSGQPASATVRAITDLDVFVLEGDQFNEIAEAFPRLYYNVGSILALRLARVSKRSVSSGAGRTSVLLDCGAPPLLGYALACSVVWHTRRPTLLLVVVDGSPAPELIGLAKNISEKGSSTGFGPFDLPDSSQTDQGRAQLRLVNIDSSFSYDVLPSLVEDLCHSYDHVLVQLKSGAPSKSISGARIRLLGSDAEPKNGTSANGRAHYVSFRPMRMSEHGTKNHEGALYVPEFVPADDQSLRDGILPAHSAAGKALGWAARDLSGLRVGLALGAGSAKGYAHIGVLKVLESIDLIPDCVVGSSVGAAVASLYADGNNPHEAAKWVDTIGASAFRLTLSRGSLLSIAGIRNGVRRLARERNFEDLSMPLAVVTADIVTGEQVAFDEGPIWPALVASMAIPGVYPAQRIGERTLVDGGVVNPVPTSVAADLGADVIVSVKLRGQSIERPKSILQTLLRSFDVMQSRIVTESDARQSILIEPAFPKGPEYSLRQFTEARAYIALGEEAARAALPRITSALPWLRK